MRKIMKKQLKNISIQLAVIFFLILASGEARAQQIPLFNQYYNTGSLAYPSANVLAKKRQLSLIYRDQFGGLVGAPRNYALAYSDVAQNRGAFSGNITGADIGFISQTKISGGYGYRLFGEGDNGLSIGAQLGVSLFSLNEDRVNPENPADNVLIDLLGANGSSASLDLSVSYRLNKLSLDLALPVLINESLSDDAYVQINDDNIPDFIGGVSYEFMLNPDLTFYPNITVRVRETIGAELDFVGAFKFKDKFTVSGGYRDNYGPTVGIGAKISEKLMFTYHYDFGKSDVPFLADGFNEFGLHLSLRDKGERIDDCVAAGEAVVNRIIEQRIFDENLVNSQDREKALCYLGSLEVGKKKARNIKSEEAYKALFAKVKAEEIANQENQRQAALEKERLATERAAAAEAKRQREEEIQKAELKRLEFERIEQEEIRARIEAALNYATASIAFNTGSAELTESSFTSLDAIVDLLDKNPEVKLALSGYTDNTGNANSNLDLSKRRAAAVKDYMVSKGLGEGRITAQGYGNENPRADNTTAEGRALNRRVEMQIINQKL